MVSTCANACGAQFQYLRQGRLFRFELQPGEPAGQHLAPSQHVAPEKKPPRKIEHFWLCERCAATLTLTLEQQRRVVVVPLPQLYARRAAAS